VVPIGVVILAAAAIVAYAILYRRKKKGLFGTNIFLCVNINFNYKIWKWQITNQA
jgi:hypothetical protein